jgi:hypothetical protein
VKLHFPHAEIVQRSEEGKSERPRASYSFPSKITSYLRRIGSFSLQQFIMRALFGDNAIFQDDNVIRIPNGSQAMGNDQNGSMGTQSVQSVLNASFSNGVYK